MLHVLVLSNRKRNQTISEFWNQHNILIWLEQSRTSGIESKDLNGTPFPLSTSFLWHWNMHRINHMTRFQRSISTIALMITCHFLLCQSSSKAHCLNQRSSICFSFTPAPMTVLAGGESSPRVVWQWIWSSIISVKIFAL